MGNVRNSESGSLDVTVKTKQSWTETVSAAQEEGLRMAKQIRNEGRQFVVEPLGPREMEEQDTIPLSGVVLQLDWKIAKRLAMVESAKDLITNAYILDSLDPGLPTVLRSIIEGKGLYEHNIGEFFQLYGQFEGKYQLTKHDKTKAKMEALLNGNQKYLKPFYTNREWKLYPLPLAVRHILAHSGNNPNTLDQEGQELRTSIELLQSWVSRKK